MNNHGTNFSRENNIRFHEKLSNHDDRIENNETNTEILVKQLNEMSSDIKVIKTLMEERNG